ncbi:wax ester/triacylglycerol synthase domain-containing protein [Streptomyces monticola]|uniref:diacylglycerol O-acyltransferase n=1 Tax=Streptomyces monticola TaxID=2666263 RepID=A0ABW2JXJ4_9ACTN
MPLLAAPSTPNPVDMLFHGAGEAASHSESVPNVGVVLHLTGNTPDLAQLRGRVSRRLDQLPCLTHTLTVRDGAPQWTPARPDLQEHVVERRTTAGAGCLDDTVRTLLHEPLPATGPAWRLVLLSGHATGRYCLVFLTHHSVQDAANIMAVAEALFGPEAGTGASSATALTPGDLRPPKLRQLLNTTAHTWRNTRPHSMWNSPTQPLSGRRHVLWQDVPTDLLKDAGRAYGATSNDVHLAALAHAITQWAGEHWPEAREGGVPIMVPVNLRTADEVALPGNRFFLARIDLPGGAMTAPSRLRRSLQATAPLKDPGYKQTLYQLSRHAPRQVLEQLLARSAAPDRLTVVGSIFKIRQSLHYHGDPVDRIVPMICCPDGFPLTVGLFLYGETSTACFQIDQALPEADQIPRLWRQAIDAIAQAAGPVPPRR